MATTFTKLTRGLCQAPNLRNIVNYNTTIKTDPKAMPPTSRDHITIDLNFTFPNSSPFLHFTRVIPARYNKCSFYAASNEQKLNKQLSFSLSLTPPIFRQFPVGFQAIRREHGSSGSISLHTYINAPSFPGWNKSSERRVNEGRVREHTKSKRRGIVRKRD